MLNKFNLKVADFASKEESRYTIQGIQVTPQATVATNGHYLVWVSTPQGHKAKDFPEVAGAPKAVDEFNPFLLASDAAKTIEKAIPKNGTIPILRTAAIGLEDRDGKIGEPVITVTDLENPQVFRPRPVEGQFPNYEAVIPTKEPVFRICLNAAYLAKIAKAAAEFSDNETLPVNLTFYGDSYAVRFDVERKEDQQGMTALLMPLRSEHNQIPWTHGWKPNGKAETAS